MTIRISEDYYWKRIMLDSDIDNARKHISSTFPTNYTPIFKSVEVSSFEEIEEYVSKGYAIKINF